MRLSRPASQRLALPATHRGVRLIQFSWCGVWGFGASGGVKTQGWATRRAAVCGGAGVTGHLGHGARVGALVARACAARPASVASRRRVPRCTWQADIVPVFVTVNHRHACCAQRESLVGAGDGLNADTRLGLGLAGALVAHAARPHASRAHAPRKSSGSVRRCLSLQWEGGTEGRREGGWQGGREGGREAGRKGGREGDVRGRGAPTRLTNQTSDAFCNCAAALS